jgi:hypothetical protein
MPPAKARARRSPAGRPAEAKAQAIVAAARGASSVAIRAGSGPRRSTRIWAVVVRGRIYVRSWSLSPGGWYRALAAEKTGLVQVGGKTSAFRAVRVRGAGLQSAIDRAYLAKYARPGEARYARDLCRPASRGSTMELRLQP